MEKDPLDYITEITTPEQRKTLLREAEKVADLRSDRERTQKANKDLDKPKKDKKTS